jgi:hypothetical protein
VNPDARDARPAVLFAETHRLQHISVAELIAYRRMT